MKISRETYKKIKNCDHVHMECVLESYWNDAVHAGRKELGAQVITAIEGEVKVLPDFTEAQKATIMKTVKKALGVKE